MSTGVATATLPLLLDLRAGSFWLPTTRPKDDAPQNGLHKRSRDVLIGVSACGAPRGIVVLMLDRSCKMPDFSAGSVVQIADWPDVQLGASTGFLWSLVLTKSTGLHNALFRVVSERLIDILVAGLSSLTILTRFDVE